MRAPLRAAVMAAGIFLCLQFDLVLTAAAQGPSIPGATRLSFPTDPGDPAVGQARQLLKPLVTELERMGPVHVGAVFVDLDRTGTPELLVQIESIGTCGTAGCRTLGYRRADGQPGSWTMILETMTGAVHVYERAGQGRFRDLALAGRDGVDLYRWNGQAYARIGVAR